MTWHCLVTVEPYDPVAGARVTLRLASASLREITGLGGARWEPALIEPPSTSMVLFDGGFGDAVRPGSARLPISLTRSRMSHAFADRAFWPGAAVKIYIGKAGDAWPWELHFSGRVKTFGREKDTLALACEVDEEPFAAEVLTATYAGTGDEEGGADLKGRAKPLVIGHAKNVEPVLIDAVNNVYQFSGYGAIEAVDALFERAASFGAATGDHADYDALVVATIPAGRWATCLAEGTIRLGAPAYGVITGDVKGHAVEGSTPRLTGEVIQALADIAGVSSALLDTDTLDAMDVAAPYPINLVLTEQTPFVDIARRLALPCNHQAGVSLTGKFFVAGIEFTSTEGQAQGEVTETRELAVSPPYARTVLGAARCWRVHGADEIAFDSPLVERGAYDAGETYRAGNIVTQPDQSRWLYVHDDPTSGNAPPAWPTTSNTWWQNIAPPVSAANVAYEDGTPIEDLKPAQAGATTNVGRGTYSDALTYNPGDMVVWAVADGGDGNGYIRIGTGPTTAVAPDNASKWAIFTHSGTGAAGPGTAIVYLYQRAASAPSAPSGTFTYTFATGVLSGGTLNGWGQPIPDVNGNPLWIIAATAYSSGATDFVDGAEFSSPVRLAADGAKTAVVQLYKRAASAPSVPSTTATYTFGTGVLTGHDNGWTQAIPASDGNPLYTITATALSAGDSDTIASGEWSAPVVLLPDYGNDIDNLEADFTALDDAIGAAESDIAAAESQIAMLLSDMAAAEADILAAVGDIGALEGDVATLESTTAAQGSIITTNATAIGGLTTNYGNLTQTVRVDRAGTLPSTFAEDGRFWFSGFQGDPATRTPLVDGFGGWASFATVSGVGRVLRAQGSIGTTRDVAQIGLIRWRPGMRLRAVGRARAVSGSHLAEVGLVPLDATYTYLGSGYVNTAATVSGSYTDITALNTADFPAGTVWVRALLRVPSTSSGQIEWVSCEFGDVTYAAGIGAQVTTNTTAISTLNSNYASLSSTVSTQGASIVTQATAISTLEGDMGDVEGDVSTLQSNYASLSSTVSTLGSTVSTQGTAITTLTGNVGTLTTNYAGLTQTVRVDRAGTLPSTFAEDGRFWFSGFQGDPATRTPLVSGTPSWATFATVSGTGRVLRMQGDGASTRDVSQIGVRRWRPGQRFKVVGRGKAVSGSHGAQALLVPLDAGYNYIGSGVITAVATVGGSYTDITALNTADFPAGTVWVRALLRVPNTTTGQIEWVSCDFGDVSEVNALGAQVTTNVSAISTLTSNYASLSSMVSTQGVTISSHSTAISTVEGNVTTLFGKAGVTVDVNGRMTGWSLNNDGETGVFEVHADYFVVSSPDSGARMVCSEGNWRAYDSSGVLRARFGVWS